MRRPLLIALFATLAVPSAAFAAPVKISPQPADVTAAGNATVEVANPNRYAVRGTATVTAGGRTVATRSVRLPRRAVTSVGLRFDASAVAALRAADGRATIRLRYRRAGGRRLTARRTLTLRLAAPAPQAPTPPAGDGGSTPSGGGPSGGGDGGASTPPASSRWTGRMGTEGAYDDFELTVENGRLQITRTPFVPVYCFELGGANRTALSFEPFVVAGPWTIGANESLAQQGIALNQLVSGGARSITYKLEDTAHQAGRISGKLGMSYFESKYDIFSNKIWFVNCSGSQSFEAVPAG